MPRAGLQSRLPHRNFVLGEEKYCFEICVVKVRSIAGRFRGDASCKVQSARLQILSAANESYVAELPVLIQFTGTQAASTIGSR